jgi:hypothetical protein
MGIDRGRLALAYIEEAAPAAIYLHLFDDSAGLNRFKIAEVTNPALNTVLDMDMCHYATSITYMDRRPPATQADIYLRRVVNDTGALGAEINLTNTPNTGERFPKVESLGSIPMVIYEDLARTSDSIVYQIAFDGQNFGAPTPVPGSTRGGTSSFVTRGNVNVLAHSDGNSPNDVIVRRGSVPATLERFGKGCSTRAVPARPYLDNFGPNLNLRIAPLPANSFNLLFLSVGRLATPLQVLGCSFYLDPTLMIPPLALIADQSGVARLDVNAPLPRPVKASLQSVFVIPMGGITTSHPATLELH